MIKGFFVSLIVSAAFFAAAWISASVLGTRSLGAKEFEDMELFKEASKLTEVVAENKVTGEMDWEFELRGTVGIVSSGADTRIKRTSGDKITLTVKAKDHRSATVTAAECVDRGGYLGICVHGNMGFFGMGDIEVEIGLPDSVYSGIELELGSGKLNATDIRAASAVLDISSGTMEYAQAADFEAASFRADIGSGKLNASDIRAAKSELDIGSGKIEYAQAAGFCADELEVNIGSGSVEVTNADTRKYEINMGSGKFDVSGLTGTGEINIGSGKGVADFAAIDPRGSVIDISSGSLEVYVPRGGSAQIEADISTGSVAIDCYGVSEKLTKDGRIRLGEGGGKFTVDISSGKVSFLDSKRFDTEQITHIIQADIISAEATGFVTEEKDRPEYVVIG